MGEARTGVEAGQCSHCCHARLVRARRGSSYLLCQRSALDATFERYPRLPMSGCKGYAAAGDPAGRPLAG